MYIKKIKILIPMGAYFPAQRYGGPPVSVENLCNTMNQEFEFYLITRDHDFKCKERLSGIPDGWVKRDNVNVIYLKETEMKRKKFERIVSEICPDLIYLQSFFSADICIPFLKIAKKMDIKVLLAVRGELLKKRMKKKYKKIPYIIVLRISGLLNNVYFQATSVEEEEQIKKIFKLDKEHHLNLSNFPIASVKKNNIEKVKGSTSLIYIARIHPLKNLKIALLALRKVKGDVQYHIYGPIEDEAYWVECKKVCEKLPQNITIIEHGSIQHEDIAKAFKSAHALLFPTQGENYGHTIVESMLNLRPVIISDLTPWLDLEEKRVGWICSLDNIEEFADAVNELVNMDQNMYDEMMVRITRYTNNVFKTDELKKAYKNQILRILHKQ